jgi:hypothetical protein
VQAGGMLAQRALEADQRSEHERDDQAQDLVRIRARPFAEKIQFFLLRRAELSTSG